MRVETFIGRRHLAARRRVDSIGGFVGSLLVRAAILTVVVGVLGFGLELASRRAGAPVFTDSFSGEVNWALVWGALIGVNAVFALFFFIPRLMGISLTAHIALLVVCTGVAAVITVMALLEGMDANFHQKHMDLVGHFEVLPESGAEEDDLASPEAIAALLGEHPHVVAHAPLVRREVLVMPERDLGGAKTAMEVYGIDPAQTREVARFVDRVTLGEANPGPGEIVLGEILARQVLGVGPANRFYEGDTIWVLSRIAIDAHAIPHIRWEELRVVGLFTTGVPELDMATAFVSLETAREMFVLDEDAVGAIQVRVDQPHRAGQIAEAFAAAHPGVPMRVRSWDQANPEFFAALRLEKRGTMVMLVMIVLVGAFSIVGTLVMIVTERTREIGMLRAMGADDALIRGIFFRGGLLIGGLGTAVGLALGLVFCAALARTELPAQIRLYDLTTIPVLIHWPTVIAVVVLTTVATVIASVVPAQVAARLDPIEALRHE